MTRPEPNLSEGVVEHGWEHPADPPTGTLATFDRLLTDLASDR